MSAWQPSAGATLLIPAGAQKHLFVVLNDPADLARKGLKASSRTKRAFKDLRI